MYEIPKTVKMNFHFARIWMHRLWPPTRLKSIDKRQIMYHAHDNGMSKTLEWLACNGFPRAKKNNYTKAWVVKLD